MPRLSRHLPQTLTEELTNIEQTEEHGILQSCAEALGHNKLVRHKDPAVRCATSIRVQIPTHTTLLLSSKRAPPARRLLTACCLSDVLRIYAPDTPFSREQLKVSSIELKTFEVKTSRAAGPADDSEELLVHAAKMPH
eukprot:scaffold244763_cov30-Tisochrysis_lutea.AAC.6